MPFTATEKAFCVLKYAQTQSNVNAQRAFVSRFHKQAPTGKQIWTWHKRFQEEGCLCRKKGSGRPAVSEEIKLAKRLVIVQGNLCEEQAWKPGSLSQLFGVS